MPDQMLEDIQFKARSGAQVTVDSAQGIVECFVAGIGNKDSVGDIVLPGAFTESLKRRKPRVVWGHSWNDPIGKVLEIYEVPNSDPRLPEKMKTAGIGGLFAKVQFNLGAEKGREAFANVAFFGEEQEWSIGYKTLQATYDPIKQANLLKEVELYEVSPVLHGANQLTGTISIKDGEVGACGVSGCECRTKTTAIEPKTPEGVVFEKGFMMGRMPMIMIPLPMPTPGHDSSDAPSRDIWSRGEATPIDAEERLKLAQEIHGRTKVPIKIIEATENMVVFLRKMTDGTNRMYQMPYEKTDSGQYKFGRPARVRPQTIYMPDSTPKPPNPFGHIHQKPNTNPILGKDPATKGVDSILIPCAIADVLETKQFLEPLLDYYNVQAVANREGLILTGGDSDFRDAADTAIKALGRRIGGGLGKGRRAGRAIRRFDPDAWDGDNDGLVQEGTPWERPSIPGVNTNLPGIRHTIRKPKGLPKDTRDPGKQPARRGREGMRSQRGDRPQRPIGSDLPFHIGGPDAGKPRRQFDETDEEWALRDPDGELRRRMRESMRAQGMRSQRDDRQQMLGREFEGVPSEDLEAELASIEGARELGEIIPELAARESKLLEELELRDWDDLYNEERRSMPEGPDAAPDPIINDTLRSRIVGMIENERQRRAEGLTPEPWANHWLGDPDDPRGGMRSRLDRPRSRDQHPSGRPWMFGEKNPVIEEDDRLKRDLWENSMERVTTDKLRTNRERRREGMRSVWDGRRDGGLKPKEDPMTGKEAPPAPVVDQAKVDSLDKQIDDLRTKKMKPLIEQLKQAREKGDAQAAHSVQKQMAELQEAESVLRDEMAEAMGRPKSDLVRPGMRSSVAPGKFGSFGPAARNYRSVGQTLGNERSFNLLETELRGLDLVQERLSPRNWDANNRRLIEKDIDLIFDMEPGDRDEILGQIHWELDDVQTAWLKMTEQIDASYDWLADHDQEIDNFLEDMDQWAVGRWNDAEFGDARNRMGRSMPFMGPEDDRMMRRWSVAVFNDHVGPDWSRSAYMWNNDDQTYELYDHDKHFAEFGSEDDAWEEPLVGGMEFNQFLRHYKDQYQQTYGDEYNVREYGIDNLRNWEKTREDAHNDSEWAVEVLERFDTSVRIESESLSYQTIDDSGTRWENYKVRGGMRSAVNRPQATGLVTNRFLEYPEDHWDAEVLDGQTFQRPFLDFGPGSPQRHRGDGGNNPGEVQLDVLGGDHEGLTRVMILDQRRRDLPADEGPNEMYLSNTYIVPSETVLLDEATGKLSFGGHTNRQASWHGMGMSGGKEYGKQDGKARNLDTGFELESWEMADVGDRPGDPIRRRDPDVGRKERLRFGVAPEPRALRAGQRPRPGMRSQRDYMDRGGMRSRHQDASNRFNRNSAETNLQELDDAARGIQEFLDANPNFNPDDTKPHVADPVTEKMSPSDEAWWDQWAEYDDLRMEFDQLAEIFEGENYEHNASLQQVDSLEESLVQLNRDLDNDVFDLGMLVSPDTESRDIHELLKNDDFDGFKTLFDAKSPDAYAGDEMDKYFGSERQAQNQWNRARTTLGDIAEHEQELYDANLDMEQTRERGEDGVWGQVQELADAHDARLLERNNRIQEGLDNPVKPITDEELNEMAKYFGEDDPPRMDLSSEDLGLTSTQRDSMIDRVLNMPEDEHNLSYYTDLDSSTADLEGYIPGRDQMEAEPPNGGMRSQRYDIRPDENGKWRVIDTANNNMPLPETYNTRERALQVARNRDRPERGGMRYGDKGVVTKAMWTSFLQGFGFQLAGDEGEPHEGWEWDGRSSIPLTIRDKGGNLLPREQWHAAPQEAFSIPGFPGQQKSPETQARHFRYILLGFGLDMTARDVNGFVIGDKPRMRRTLKKLLNAEHPEVENGLDFPDDIPTVREILEKVPGLHRKNRHFGEAEWAKLVAEVDEGRDVPEIMRPKTIVQRFDDEFKRLELQRTFSLTDDQLKTVLDADNAPELLADWDSDPEHPLRTMDDGKLADLLAYLDEDPRGPGGGTEPPEDLDVPDAPSPPTPPPVPAGVRDPDDVPRSGMRTMSAQNRKQRRDEISEKLDVLNVGLRSALGDRNSDPAEVNRMLNTESRLRVERLELRQADTLASLESGSRSRIRAKKDLEILLSDDEIGSLRAHLKKKIRATEDPDAKAAFATYDTLLANTRGNKVKVPMATYDNIVNHWEAAVASNSRVHPKTGRDILEFAAINNDGKFTSPGMTRGSGEYSGFRSSRINNGAPPDITPRMQREMLDNWASGQESRGRVGYQPPERGGMRSVGGARSQRTDGMRGDHGLMLNAMREDKHGSPRQWQILRGQHGMRSESRTGGPVDRATTPGGKRHDGTDVGDGRGAGEQRSTRGQLALPSDLPGAKRQRGRQMGAVIEDTRSKGKPFAEVKPDGWDEMGTQEKWDFLMAELGPESGMRQLDYDRLVTELGRKLDTEERRAARKRGEFPSLEERRARREAQGVGRSRQREETADRVSEPAVNRTTKEGAQKERQTDLIDLSDRAGRSHHAVSLAEQDGDADGSHADLWAQVGDVFDESDDLTFSQLERVDALLEDYVSGAQPAELSAAETASMANAQKLKGRIENRLEHYRDNQFIQQGEGLATGSLTASDDVGDSYNMLSSGGMRMIRNNRDSFQTDVLQRYAEARRREGSRGRGRGRIEEAASRGGMRSQGNGKPGRTQINEKASFFKGIGDSLSVEIREANNKDDRKTAAALKLLQDIMSRQESGKMGEKRTDAGSITVTQAELDQIMDGLLAVVDRQNARGGSRTEMFSQLLEMFAEAGMSTFVLKTTDEIHARTQRRRNARGDIVEIPLTTG